MSARLAAAALMFAMVFAAAQTGAGAGVAAQSRGAALQCVSFTTGRLGAGSSFRKPIGGRLEARLLWDNGRTWGISVGPAGTDDNYLWVVSPPFRTAPHLMIGPGYHLTAHDSAKLSPREFRFVTSAAEFASAKALVDRALSDAGAAITVDDIERRGRGSLSLTITEFKLGADGSSLAWVRVDGKACQPRS